MKYIKFSRRHLEETGWTYHQHFMHSVKQSMILVQIAIKSIIHGIFPWLYASSGPLGVYRLYKEIRRYHHVQKIFAVDDLENKN